MRQGSNEFFLLTLRRGSAGWRGVDFNACLDHVFSNADITNFQVVKKGLSDHHGISLDVNVPCTSYLWPEPEQGRNQPASLAAKKSLPVCYSKVFG
jgi:hypothetical protein